MAASGRAALTLSAATRASSASTVTWSALFPTLVPTAYHKVMTAASSDRQEGEEHPRPTVPGVAAASAAGRSHRLGDVLAQRVRLALNVVEPLLHHVADADHAAQPPVLLDHRNVPDAAVAHQRHDPAH